MNNFRFLVVLFAFELAPATQVLAQFGEIHTGSALPRDVRELYENGLEYLAKSQEESGAWSGGQDGPGVTGMAVMCFLASGEDPNFGQYAGIIRRGLKSIISQQAESTVRRDRELNDAYGRLTGEYSLSLTADRRLLIQWAAHNVQQIGIYASMICERAIFVATGEIKEFR